jgi:LPXTG-motif cell wall-anchored protein
MYLDDVTLAPNAERVAAAQTTLAKTGGDFTWLLVPGLMAAVVGSGLVAASRRKRI